MSISGENVEDRVLRKLRTRVIKPKYLEERTKENKKE